jgi:hypothetical protein
VVLTASRSPSLTTRFDCLLSTVQNRAVWLTAWNNLSVRLSDLGKREDALTANEEAISKLLLRLEVAPYMLPDSGVKLVQRYIACCEAVAQDPDPELMARFVAVLQAVGLIEQHDERS